MPKYFFVLLMFLLLPISSFANSPTTSDQMLLAGLNKNDLALVKKSIVHGADVNQIIRQEDGYNTPLTLAVFSGNLKIASLLLDNGANVNYGCQAFDYWLTPLCIAILNNDFKMVELLIEHKADVNLAIKTTTINSFMCIETATPNVFWDFSTPLMTALQQVSDKNSLSLPLVKLLIKSGADINKANYYGFTPLVMFANYANFPANDIRLQAVKELITAGAVYGYYESFNTDDMQQAYDADSKRMLNFLMKFQQN